MCRLILLALLAMAFSLNYAIEEKRFNQLWIYRDKGENKAKPPKSVAIWVIHKRKKKNASEPKIAPPQPQSGNTQYRYIPLISPLPFIYNIGKTILHKFGHIIIGKFSLKAINKWRNRGKDGDSGAPGSVGDKKGDGGGGNKKDGGGIDVGGGVKKGGDSKDDGGVGSDEDSDDEGGKGMPDVRSIDSGNDKGGGGNAVAGVVRSIVAALGIGGESSEEDMSVPVPAK